MERQFAYHEVLEKLAPCGLDCERCVAFEDGRVKRSAAELAAALEGFEKMVPKITDRAPALLHYERFVEVLAFLAQAACAGCRAGGAQLPFCAARTCHREQGVDYCFQCREYPCDRNSFPENLALRWRSNNDRMRDVGAVQFYRESLGKARY
jgi:hypothetical protein